MALSLMFAGPDDGKFDCDNRILRCFACGGEPPYTWSSTAGSFDKTTGITVKLSAPVNVKPGVTGNAYVLATKFCTSLGFTDCVCATYDCAGVVTVACGGIGCATYMPASCGAGTCAAGVDVCTLFADVTSPESCLLAFAGAIFADGCTGLPSLHFTSDLRTQQMKDDGCAPCHAVMEGVVVTVTDSVGHSVSRTLKT